MTSFGKLEKDRSGRTIFAKLFGRTPVIDEGLQGEDPEIIELLKEHERTHGYHDPRDWNTRRSGVSSTCFGES